MAYALSVPRRFFILFLAVLITVGLFLGYRAQVSPEDRLVISSPSIPFITPLPEAKPAVEIFPAALDGRIPAILTVNQPPKSHHPTPLFIGFTRNWPILQQSIVSYIAAGWPPVDIYVVDNTGTMDSNELVLLTLQNPFFVDYSRLRTLGVNIIITPTLLSFAQLQNFFLYTAIRKKWGHYYWSHMDSAVLSDEEKLPYKSLYQKIIDNWNSINKTDKWAIKFFAYDHLALVNVAAYKDVGGWDTHIPFYITDCDFHARLHMKNYTTTDENVGHIFDVGGTVPDLSVFYPGTPSEPLNSERFKYLHKMLDDLQRSKNDAKYGRNRWQAQQRGGKGEPFYRNPVGFEKAIIHWIKTGRTVFAEKWGHRDCDIFEIGKEIDKAWEYKKDWWV
ncbi:hypothetical protein L873DRAFT_1789159 [Choiromyces venosus 120613-1]|uniref:Nucleotide-diphospho-sugar transferase n=1 Tax=Choiromyces venosus 120613-1 TaxID=1336337 RepID=A0A3N4JTS3_9PEZI|nr:hypothetical protein L873DRAFT_1789159 [Choiromyces venosus 120613-1]